MLIVEIYEIFLIAFGTPDQSDQISLVPYENIISEEVGITYYIFMKKIAFSVKKNQCIPPFVFHTKKWWKIFENTVLFDHFRRERR